MASYREEYIKCAQDKSRIYFISNYLYITNADAGTTTPFNLLPRQKVLLQNLVDNRNVVAIKPRQSGITTTTAAWAAGQCVFASPDFPETILCIGNKKDISEQLLSLVKTFLLQVPRWMWGGNYYSPDPNSPKNTKKIFVTDTKDHVKLFNGCQLFAKSSKDDAARGVPAVSILIFDEAAFIENSDRVYSQAVATTSSVKDSRIVMISTPNGKDKLYYNTYKQAQEKKNNFVAVEFKWFQDPRYNRHLKWWRKNEETGKIEWEVETTLTPRGDIPYDEERWSRLEREGWKPTSPWFTKMCQSFNNDKRQIAQELEVSFLGSSDTVVDVEVIEYHQTHNVIEITDDWPLKDPMVQDTWIWNDPVPGHRYIMAVDPSSGSSEDSTALEIIDIDAIDENGMPFFEQVLEYNGKVTGDSLGEIADEYGRVYNNALIVVECIGGYGDAVVLMLMRKRYPNLYYDEAALKDYTKNGGIEKFNNAAEDRLPGFRTNSVRIQMISNFVGALQDNLFRIKSIRVINELHTWIWKNSRPDHMSGYHDDTLTCLAMGIFIIQYYMIQKEKDKKYTAAVLHSWRSGSGVSRKEIGEEKREDIRKKYTMPFISSKAKQAQEQRNRFAWLLR